MAELKVATCGERGWKIDCHSEGGSFGEYTLFLGIIQATLLIKTIALQFLKAHATACAGLLTIKV
jgi:hypothetical protein